jgi:Ubinuclein conserved middle domain
VFADRQKGFTEVIPLLYAEIEEEIDKEVKLQKEGLFPEPPTPAQKFKWNSNIRVLFWNILCIEWEMAWIVNETKILNKEDPGLTV